MKNETLNAAIVAIMNADSTEINTIIDAVKARQSKLRQQATSSFNVGDSVQFTTRKGMLVTGVISKINTKTVKVKVKDQSGFCVLGEWRVSSGLLTKIEA